MQIWLDKYLMWQGCPGSIHRAGGPGITSLWNQGGCLLFRQIEARHSLFGSGNCRLS